MNWPVSRLFALTSALAFVGSHPADAAPKVDFNRDIRPLLSDNCFACHGPDAKKVKGGLRLDLRDVAVKPAKSDKIAIVPGKPDESELVRRIFTTDPDDRMPPPESNKTLTTAQKDLFKRWIAEGAQYQGHWAYTAPVKAKTPPGAGAVDFLVRQHLSEVGLHPSPPADRRTLARRLHTDLTGIPPTPDEVDAFERDRSPGAYALLVERLLASPQFGERMALGWLDVARFADTIGYHSDNPRDIWPYRDYVIRSFNRNKPFDQFTREQLAGDLLPDATLEQRVASAFNRLLLTTEEGGAQPKDYEARYLTDRVRAIGSVWLGQTLGCCQCHDHKFDPASQRDFYSMGAFFADIKEPIIGSRGPGMLVPTDDQAKEIERHAKAVAGLQRDFDGSHPEIADAFAAWQREQRAALAADALWTRQKPARVESTGGATLKIRDDLSVIASDKNPDKDTYTLQFTNDVSGVLGLRIEALPDDALPSKGPGRSGNGNFVLTEVVARVETAGATPRALAFDSARASYEQTSFVDDNPYKLWSAASAIDGDAKGDSAGWAVLPETGKAHQLLLELKEPLSLKPGEMLVVELQQRHGHKNQTLGHFRIGTTTSAEAARSVSAPPPTGEFAELLAKPADQLDNEQKEKLFAHYKQIAPALAGLRQQLADAKKAKGDFEATVARCLVTERNDKPRTVRILPRGNFLIETGDAVEPALPAYLRTSTRPTGDRRLTRLDLADWLVARENPLTARVTMNRLWKQFFGIGLSKVLDDFGAQGEPPANPALLDWLAVEFMDSGWDLKHMVRVIVLSETYRQVSTASRELLARDPYNRELARQSRWRLEAELVRDNALALGGLLVPAIGGPSTKPYQPDGYWENLNFPVRSYEASRGAGQYRRGLYTWWQRSFPHPSMVAFDAPSREECAAERSRSNIPQQALVLLNDPTYVEAARAFATRILRECHGNAEQRLTWAWRQALDRSPSSGEIAIVRGLLEKHLTEYRQNPEAAESYLKVGANAPPSTIDAPELAAWTNVARAILNLHEVITRS
jgi:hypothetical protein